MDGLSEEEVDMVKGKENVGKEKAPKNWGFLGGSGSVSNVAADTEFIII